MVRCISSYMATSKSPRFIFDKFLYFSCETLNAQLCDSMHLHLTLWINVTSNEETDRRYITIDQKKKWRKISDSQLKNRMRTSHSTNWSLVIVMTGTRWNAKTEHEKQEKEKIVQKWTLRTKWNQIHHQEYKVIRVYFGFSALHFMFSSGVQTRNCNQVRVRRFLFYPFPCNICSFS